jgi:type VI secretion system secreted protein VgrG
MKERQLTLHAPVLGGDQQLFVRGIEGREAISELFAYEVTLYAKSDNVDFAKVLGQEMCVGLLQPRAGTGAERYFHGYVAAFSAIGTEGEFHLYRAELRPHLWRLTRAINCRAFQGETIPDVIATVLGAHGLGALITSFSRHYLPWEYCVQYRESDFAFLSRLMEGEGIHYFFKHEKDKHVLILADSNLHETVPGYEEALFKLDASHHLGDETVWSLSVSKRVLADRSSATDFDFTKPSAPLLRGSGSEVKREHQDAGDHEAYDHLSSVVQQVGYTPELVEEYARIRSEELHSHYAVALCESDMRGLAAGHCFKLKGHRTPSRNGEYLVLSTQLQVENDTHSSGGGGASDFVFRCTFEVIEAKTPFRPTRSTPKPRIAGPQSATVVGPAGAKHHYTDQWGRVFVKFHWYRKLEESDRDSSCWVRVAQNSAGANWGSMFVPHLGQEVVVSFYEGDPDRPIITGQVYNGSNKPPLSLPTGADKSIFRDRAGNEIILDSSAGAEQLRMHCPASHTVFIMGTDGAMSLTPKTLSECSFDKTTFAFGHKTSYTKGWSWAVDRGTSVGLKAGVGASMTVGTDFKLSAGASVEFKAGIALSYQMSTSVVCGYGSEFKSVTGSYRQVSTKDAVFDSQTAAFVTGGKNDNSMLRVDDKEVVLSFDDSESGRSAEMDKAFSAAREGALMAAGLAGAISAVGVGWYKQDMEAVGPMCAPDGATEEIERQHAEIKRVARGDIAPALNALVSTAAAYGTAEGATTTSPTHARPSAKVLLKKDLVRIFAGEKEESKLLLGGKNGIMLTAEKPILLESKQGNIKVAAKTELALQGATIKVTGTVTHKNLTVSK